MSDSGTSEVCTDGGVCNCATLNVALIGKAGKYGTGSDSTDGNVAFRDWLNSSSSGTAKVDSYSDRPTLDAAFLAQYNVIILESLSDDSENGPFWTFTADEVAAVQDWVVNQAGGIITLTGYSGSGAEVNGVNQLIAFSGISYNTDSVFLDCELVDQYNNQLCWCGGSNQITEWNKTDPVIVNLSYGVTMIGVADGRSINAPADAHVAATFTQTGAPTLDLLVGKLAGKGRVLVFMDEWITYTSQWNGDGNPNSTNTACQGYLPQQRYQTAQFWYNMIKWSQPTASCFQIQDQQQPVQIW